VLDLLLGFVMRSNGNFHPEWGYLAPSSSFIRTARIALIAVVVGGIAGASVVLPLVERPAGEGSVAARTLPRSDEVTSPVITPRAAQMTPQAALQNQTMKPAPTDGSRTASQSDESSNAQPPTSDAAVTEVPLAKAASPASARLYRAPATDKASPQKKATRKVPPRYASRGEHVHADRGPRRPFADQSLFGANVPAEYYPRRGYSRYYGEQRWGDYYSNRVFDYR
jgi:hypothetical protein